MTNEQLNSILAALLIARRYVLTNPDQHASVVYAINLVKAAAAAPAAPLTTQQITQIARKHGIVYTNRHYSESPAVAFSQNGLMAFLAEVGIGGGGK